MPNRVRLCHARAKHMAASAVKPKPSTFIRDSLSKRHATELRTQLPEQAPRRQRFDPKQHKQLLDGICWVGLRELEAHMAIVSAG